MSKKVLVATVKPFAPAAVGNIERIFAEAGYELEKLESYGSTEEFKNAVASVDALIVRSDKVTADILGAAGQLKIVVRAGAGFDNVDLAVATERDVVVMNTPGQNSNAVAELVFGLMLNLARREYTGKSGIELKGKSLGIHAYGNVGRLVNRIAAGFSMETYAYDPFVSREVFEADGVGMVETAAQLYKTCDFVSLHLPKMAETIGLVNYDLLNVMKPGAAVINTARAEVVDEESLLKIFAERDDLFYAADVAPARKSDFEEKFPGRYFFTAKKMGAQTAEANVNAGIAAAKQIVNFFEHNELTFKVN